METQYKIRILRHCINQCKHCGKTHNYNLEIRYYSDIQETPEILVFAGKGGKTRRETRRNTSSVNSPTDWEVVFVCPDTKKSFVESIKIDPQEQEEIVGVTSNLFTKTPKFAMSTQLVEQELQEWVKSSASNAREFCKTMLTTALGAIPIFFASLAYLGFEQAKTSLIGWIGIAPPFLFLISSVIFILALRPQAYSIDGLTDFNGFRTKRLTSMNMLIRIGTILFIGGIFLSIEIFFLILSLH